MKKFLVRVELHGAKSSEDYKKLHDALAVYGFTRTVVKDGVTYRLPTGTYKFKGNEDILTVRDTVKTAANTTGFTSSIILAECGPATYLDLEPEVEAV